MMLYNDYLNSVTQTLTAVEKESAASILTAAEKCAKVIADDGIIYIFGCGHSSLLAADNFYRAGGLACISAVFDSDLMLHDGAAKSSAFERMEGIAQHVFNRYRITDKDILIVITNSGINPVPIDMALLAKSNGIPVIGVTSSSYHNAVSRHSSGLLFFECVDVLLDTHAPCGDAALEIPNLDTRMGAISTIAGAYVLNSLFLESARIAAENGIEVPVYKSGNIPGGKEYNQKLIDRYMGRIKNL